MYGLVTVSAGGQFKMVVSHLTWVLGTKPGPCVRALHTFISRPKV